MNLSDQLSLTAKENLTKTAYIFNDEETSYRELEGAVTKFASSLKELGYEKGDHIALVVGNTPHYIIGLYGAMRLGVTVIPVNPIYTVEEMAYIMTNGDVKGVITLDVLMEKFEHLDQKVSGIEHYIVGATSPDSDLSASTLAEKISSFEKLTKEVSLELDRPTVN